jgi:acid stress-induced BolA-like protein IbaG/YrbA
MLQRQQSVLSLFNEELTSGKLHALSIIARTPDEHAAQNSAGLVQIKL